MENGSQETAGNAANSSGNGSAGSKVEENAAITYTVVPEEGASVTGDETVEIGKDASFFVSLAEGYEIIRVEADGEEINPEEEAEIASEDVEYKLVNVQSDVDVVVTVEKSEDVQALSVEADGITISVKAVEGHLNPAIVQVSATPVEDEMMHEILQKEAEKAGKTYEETRIFDIRLLDKDGNELQPGCKVKVSFERAAEAAALSADEETEDTVDVFCLKEKNDSEIPYEAENMDGKVNEETGDIEFETTHFTPYGYGISTTAVNGDIPSFADEPWCTVDYKETSDYIDVDYSSLMKGEDGIIYLDAYINEAAEGDLVFTLHESMIRASAETSKYMSPGDSFNLKLKIHNNSSHPYVYKDGSVVIATPDTRGMDTLENPPIGFDGQVLPRLFTGVRTPNSAIQNLFGVTKSSAVTVENMLTIYDKLAEAGYTGNEALTNYYLDFYNSKYGTNAVELKDLPSAAFKDMTNTPSSSNGIYTINIGAGQTFEELADSLANQYPLFDKCAKITSVTSNSFKLQIYEPESQISSLIYNKFYQELMAYTLGRFVTSKEANTMDSLAPIGIYMDESTGALSEVNDYLNSAVSLPAGSGESELIMGMYINGPKMGNAYQNYDFAWYTAIELVQADYVETGSIQINKVDENGAAITAPATFNLYKMAEDGITPLYYAVDGTWTADQSQAEALVTENGSVSVSGIECGVDYYILETAAPQGYDKAQTPLKVTLETKSQTVNFTNTKTAPMGEYTITINYYEKGTANKLHTSEFQVYKEAESLVYDVTALVTGVAIDGYKYDSWQNLQNAGLSGTIGQNLVFDVYYTKESTYTPSGGGSTSGGGGGGSSNTRPGRDTSTPAGGPGVTTTIGETEVPLASGPVTEPVTIPDDMVPLAPLPKTGDTSGNKNGMMLLMSSLLLAFYGLIRKREDANE